jgi:hypothetical protein
VVATETQAPHYWLHYAEDQKAFNPSYSISEFKEDIRAAGAQSEEALAGQEAGKRCRWLRVFCEKLDQIIEPGHCPGCDVLPSITEALR